MNRPLWLLSRLFLRSWRRHPLRQALAALSVSLGVALFLSTTLTTGAVAGAVLQAEEALLAGVDLTVSRPAAGLDEREVAALRARPEFAGASGVVQVHARAENGTTLTLLGLDPARDREVRVLEGRVRLSGEGPLRLLQDPASLLLTEEGLSRLGVRPGERLALTTCAGRHGFTVAGSIEIPGPARALLRDHGFLLLSSAQALFGRRGKVDRVDLRLGPGVGSDEGERAARAAVGPGAVISRPGDAARESLSAFEGMRAILLLNSLLTLVVAVFFIFNTVSASVAERARDVGLLRSLGLTRGGLRLLVLGEAAVLGLLGYGLGLPLGIALARGSLALMVQTVGSLYFPVPPVSGIAPRAPELVEAALLSLGTAATAALLASVPLLRSGPLELLRPVAMGLGAGRRLRTAAVAGLLLLLAGVALPLLVPPRAGTAVGRLSVLLPPVAIALLAPWAALATARRLRPLLVGRVAPAVWLALDATATHPARTAVTVVTFALSLGLVIGHGGMARSMEQRLSEWLLGAIPGDLILSGSGASPVSLLPFSDEALAPLAGLPGVEAVFRARMRIIEVSGRKAGCLAMDVAVARGRAEHEFVAGEPEDVYRRTIAGEAVLVSENLAWQARLSPGDRVVVQGIEGPAELPVAGVIRDYNSPLGTLYMDLALYRRLFRDPLIDFGELCLEPGARAEIGRALEAARGALPPEYSFLEVLPRREFADRALGVVRDLNDLSFAGLALALVIGAAGILATVTLSVLRRTRELALVRAVGMDARGLRRTVLWEVAGLAAVASALGLLLGNLAFVPGNLLFREIAGFHFGYRFPALHMGLALLVAAATALLSSLLPLRHVGRIEMRALEEE